MRWKTIFALCVTLVLIIAIRFLIDAQRTASRMNVQGRLSQLHLALANYQAVHGSLPNRVVADLNGDALHSWVASILPYVEQHDIANSLDLTNSWNASENETSLKMGADFWDWFCDDGYLVCTYSGTQSMWDADEKPVGTLAEHPRKVLLIATKADGVHPLEPSSISERRVREILMTGNDVLYVDAGRMHGHVKIHGESIRFDGGMTDAE